MKTLLIRFFAFSAMLWLAVSGAFAQAPAASMFGYERAPTPVWARHFGGPEDDGAYAVLALDEGGYAIAGDCIAENGDRQMCLMKLGRYGDLIFKKIYTGSGVSSARALRTTNDGGFVLSGSTRGPGGTGTDLYVVKTDYEGDVEWSRISQDRGGDFSEDILHARGGGFVSAGKNALDLKGAYNIVKLNKPGTVVWTRNFSGEQANAIIEIDNGGVAAIGYTKTIPEGTIPVIAEADPQFPWVESKKKHTGLCDDAAAFLFTEVDWKGVVLKERVYWYGKHDVGNALAPTPEGGYVFAGSAGGCPKTPSAYDCWVMQTDSLGDTLWTRTFGGVQEDQAYSILAEDDGGFVIAGSTRSWGQGGVDMLLFKVDGRGSVLWSTAIGGPGDDICYEVQHTDGGYILSGTTTSYGEGDNDMYLVKVERP